MPHVGALALLCLIPADAIYRLAAYFLEPSSWGLRHLGPLQIAEGSGEGRGVFPGRIAAEGPTCLPRKLLATASLSSTNEGEKIHGLADPSRLLRGHRSHGARPKAMCLNGEEETLGQLLGLAALCASGGE